MSVLDTDRYNVSDLVDVTDIGAGHSVYLLQFQSASFVIKQEPLETHSFMAQLLQQLGWVSLKSYHLKNDAGAWELTEYAGPYTLEKWLHHLKNPVSDVLVRRLARHSALSDCVGRGDRHFENYVLKGYRLVPIDLSYLFSDHHERWVMTYTKAGMNEMGALQCYFFNPKKLLKAMILFLIKLRMEKKNYGHMKN